MKRIYNRETKDFDLVPSENYGPNKYLVSDADGNPRWEDKLTYKNTVETVILPETTGVINNDGEYASFEVECEDFREKVKVGDIVLVSWNGEIYECTAYEEGGDPTLGDLGNYEKYPFGISPYFNKIIVNVNESTPTGTEITLSLTKKETIIKPIPAEYLPGYDLVIEKINPYGTIDDVANYRLVKGDVASLAEKCAMGLVPTAACRSEGNYDGAYYLNWPAIYVEAKASYANVVFLMDNGINAGSSVPAKVVTVRMDETGIVSITIGSTSWS